MAKLTFQQTLLQSSVPRDPSEIIWICWFVAQKYFLLLSMLSKINLIEFQKSKKISS